MHNLETLKPSLAMPRGDSATNPGSSLSMPLMTPAAFSAAIGLEVTVFKAQFERGYWGAPIRIGKRVFVNVEALRIKCAERALEFAL